MNNTLFEGAQYIKQEHLQTLTAIKNALFIKTDKSSDNTMDALNIALALLKGLPWTMALTFAAFITGSIMAVFLCTLRLSQNRLIASACGIITLLLRSIPPIVWLFVMFFVFSQYLWRLSPFTAAVLSLALITAAYMAEIYRGALKGIRRGQYEASAAMGFNSWQKYRYIIAPQTFRHCVPAASSYAIGLLKDSAIASVIGVAEITQIAGQMTQKTFKGMEIYAIAALLYFFLSLLVAWFSRWLDARLRTGIGT